MKSHLGVPRQINGFSIHMEGVNVIAVNGQVNFSGKKMLETKYYQGGQIKVKVWSF